MTSQNPEVNYEALEKYGRDLVEEVRQGKMDPVIGRDEEIRNTIRILSRKTKNNPVLIGEPGVGKTAIVEGLAQRIVRKDVPESLLDKTIFELQARDWDQKPQRAVADSQLAQWMRVLQLNGVKNYGYYPDDFINNQPDISRIRPQFSSWWYPDHD